MRRSLLLAFFIALWLPLLSKPVDETTAKQLAQIFWKENNIMGVQGDEVFKKQMDDARFVNVAPQCGYTEFYIFNNEDGKGFVIIAADDCVTPILGYSYDNNFAAENLPPNLKGWLDGYAEQIQMAIDTRITATDEIRNDWECLRQGKNMPIKTETAVSPLITTFWDQGEPYNRCCPYNSLTGEYTQTGCVATAMAQIMKYWEYPTHGYGSHSYSDWFYGNISANFANTTYQWSSMPSRLYTNSSQTQINAVATLMFHCGVSVEMNYGVDGSGASTVYDDYDGYHTYCAENALKNYFGYSSAIGRKRTGYYSDSEWINLLKSDLDESIPVLYDGQGSGRHAFICDGYNYNNYFHFNWGWSGQGQGTYNDAYYYINNLNPNSNNFSNYQVAVFGICPPSYFISAMPNPSEGGSVTGYGYYYANETCTLHAIANTGYSFVNWTEDGAHVASNPNYSFTVTRFRYLEANFQRNNYTISVEASPANSGTVTGGDTYPYGQSCTVKATAKTDYVFVNWTENGAQVSTNANYTFTVSSDRNLVANFQRNNHTIRLLAHPTAGGSVSGDGTYSPNQTCTVRATPNIGYVFEKWTENGTQVSTNTNYSFTVTSNRNLVAHFIRSTHTILTSVGANGSISPSGTISVAHGADQSFTITPDQDYQIKEIYIDGSAVGATSTYTFTNVIEDHRIYATFIKMIGVDETNEQSIAVYPNPTPSIVNINFHNLVEVKVFNALGIMVKRQIIEGEDNVQIDLSAFSDGLYLLQATSPTQTTTIRVVKAE